MSCPSQVCITMKSLNAGCIHDCILLRIMQAAFAGRVILTARILTRRLTPLPSSLTCFSAVLYSSKAVSGSLEAKSYSVPGLPKRDFSAVIHGYSCRTERDQVIGFVDSRVSEGHLLWLASTTVLTRVMHHS